MGTENSGTGCRVCSQAITQPVCSSCLAEQMIEWLRTRKLNDKKSGRFSRLIQEAEFHSFENNEQEAVCALCGSPMTICAHCFCTDVYYLVAGLLPELEQEFLTHFDYDIRFRSRKIPGKRLGFSNALN